MKVEVYLKADQEPIEIKCLEIGMNRDLQLILTNVDGKYAAVFNQWVGYIVIED